MTTYPFFKPTYRTLPEQLLGLSIFLCLSFASFFHTTWMGAFGLPISLHSFWLLSNWASSPFWAVYHLLVPASIWVVWRRFSIYTLKLEVSLFLTQLSFQFLWCITLFFYHEPLLSLFFLLFQLCNLTLCFFLYGKKEKIAQPLLIPAFMWILYITAINMALT